MKCLVMLLVPLLLFSPLPVLSVVPGNQDMFGFVGVTACLRAPPSHADDNPSHQFRLDMRVAPYTYLRHT
jgi:hypothetical protein